jgi:hypothetical protein
MLGNVSRTAPVVGWRRSTALVLLGREAEMVVVEWEEVERSLESGSSGEEGEGDGEGEGGGEVALRLRRRIGRGAKVASEDIWAFVAPLRRVAERREDQPGGG